ncbi:MAG TPA: lysylphosphatidylglycerol synthase transmembrane domain-containing protein [Candidatus Nanoarchaeia archaeon]|nr:lysylphosphatidylglycerol synthase transmembrane domain-containing protein [Candidatus Nanoarchaeia archaeon]
MVCGLAVFALYLYFFVGINQIFLVVKDVNLTNYVVFYSLAISTMLVVLLCWVSSWRELLKTLNVKISLKNAYLYYWTGYFVDLIVPCQQVCGEVTRLYLVEKETGKNYGSIGAAGITNRIIGYSVVTTSLTAGLIYLLIRGKIPAFASDLLIISWLGAVTYLSILLYLALSSNAAERLASLILKVLKALRIKRYRSGEEISPGLLVSLSSFHAGFEFFRANPRYLIKPLAFMTASYALNFSVYVLIFYALGFNHLLLDFFLLVYFLAGAVQDATSAFSVGGLEILLTNIFIFFGIAPAASGVAAAVLRSVTFWLPIVVGYIVVQAVGAKSLLSPKVREKIRIEQEIEKTGATAQQSQDNPPKNSE